MTLEFGLLIPQTPRGNAFSLVQRKNGPRLDHRDLMRALELSRPVMDELPALNRVLRRTRSLQDAAAGSRDPAAALAYLQAADRVIQVDEFDYGPG